MPQNQIGCTLPMSWGLSSDIRDMDGEQVEVGFQKHFTDEVEWNWIRLQCRWYSWTVSMNAQWVHCFRKPCIYAWITRTQLLGVIRAWRVSIGRWKNEILRIFVRMGWGSVFVGCWQQWCRNISFNIYSLVPNKPLNYFLTLLDNILYPYWRWIPLSPSTRWTSCMRCMRPSRALLL